MNLIDALLGEHAIFYSLFDHFDAMIEGDRELGEIKRAAVILGAALDSHSILEEELLFEPLVRYLPPEGPISVLRLEHGQIASGLEAVAGTDSLEDAVTSLSRVIQLSRHHFSKEEHVLFPSARQALDEATLSKLGDEWADRRNVLVA